MTIKLGGSAPVNSGNSVNFYKPNSTGNNFIVVLNEPDVDWANSGDVVKMFKVNKFGTAYPINASWVYLGKGQNDPKDVLAPDLKLAFAALIPVAYQENKEWKFGLWQIQSANLFNMLVTLENTNGVVGKVINVVLSGKAWNVMPAGKIVPPSDAVLESFREEVPDTETLFKILGKHEDADSIFEMILARNGLSSKDELFALFNIEDELI